MKHNLGFDKVIIEHRRTRSLFALTFRLYSGRQLIRVYAKKPCFCVPAEYAAAHAQDDLRRLFKNVTVEVITKGD